MHIPPELLPVVQITIPLIAAIFGAAWMQNKRLDDIIRRLERIEAEIVELRERVARLEERTPPLIHH